MPACLQENERIAALAAQVRALNEASAAGVQLAAQYPAFQRYDRKGLAAALRFYGAAELPPAMVDWALDLTRHHMSALYEACPDWGWSDARKRGELADPAARHLVVYQQGEQQQGAGQQQGGQQQQRVEQAAPLAAPAACVPAAAEQENQAAAGNGGGGAELGQPVAFVHFRFEEEEGEAVLYCYEIQVAAAVQVRLPACDALLGAAHVAGEKLGGRA